MRQRHVVHGLARGTIGSALLAGTLLFSASSVAAADAVDQANSANGSVDVIHDVIIAAQTYTAGRTGSLNRVDLSIGRIDDPGTLTIAIEGVSGALPDGTLLAVTTLAAATVPDDGELHDVSVSLPASLSTAGGSYAIVLAAPAAPMDTAWFWATDSTDGYAGGSAFQGDTKAATWTIHPTDDRTFATWVDSTPCAPGTYSSTGYGPCVNADPGHFVAGIGATAQALCAVGSFQALGAAVACDLAPIGTYVDTTGATAATPCPTGSTTAAPGATSASVCESSAPPPTISCVATPGALWPPNNKLVAVNIAITTTNATGFSLVSVTADGGSAGDLVGWTVGTPDTAGQLRASRNGGGGGRTYSLVYQAFNASGATAGCTATVTVPHDQGHR
jgi:hypothetical protein